ncbi:hypothetical protein [Streptomyces longwoodensis]|uniref:hypothetical protein n=1 Tax=Streptomyces longwoodensis TaxID=68231 RepID=UPI0036FDF0DB
MPESQPEKRLASLDEFEGPEPPPTGTVDYRRVILRICAAHTQAEFEERLRPVFEWRGWRAGVEVMVELTGALSAGMGQHLMDAFGNIRVDDAVVVMDDEEILRTASRLAPMTHPDLPPHEALALSIQEGETMRELTLSLVPVWNQAATVLANASHVSDLEPARVLFTRWLNENHRARRTWAGNLAASITHTHFRDRVMPPGDEWIEEVLDAGPDLRRWISVPAPVPGQRHDKKRGGRCCPNCGKRRRR